MLDALNQLIKGAQMIATEHALFKTQVKALEEANKATYIRKSRKRKAFVLEDPMSVPNMQYFVEQEEVQAQIQEEMLRPAKQIGKCSKYGSENHNARTCVL